MYKRHLAIDEDSMADAFAGFVNLYINSKESTIALRKFIPMIGKILPQFKGNYQHDAQEVYYLLNPK